MKDIGGLMKQAQAMQQKLADAQARLQERVSELDAEVHEEEFQYWRRRERPGKHRR